MKTYIEKIDLITTNPDDSSGKYPHKNRQNTLIFKMDCFKFASIKFYLLN